LSLGLAPVRCSFAHWVRLFLLLAALLGWGLAGDIARAADSAADPSDSPPEAEQSVEEGIDDPEANDEFDLIEEMVVSGQKSAMASAEATSSVTSFGSVDIEEQNFSDLRDISAFTPNLEIKSSFGASSPTIFIRGVGLNDFNANSSSAVAIYNDEIYMNSPAGQLGQIFDLEGIEVLRGPQGSLYRNASAGVIRVISRKPTGEFSGRLIATYGNYDTQEFQGAVELPLIDDTLSWRGSFRFNQRDGTTRNGCGNLGPGLSSVVCGGREIFGGVPRPPTYPEIPQGLDVFVNNKKNWAARSLLRWQPDSMDWILKFHGGKNLGGAMQFQHVGTWGQSYGNLDRSQYRDRTGDPYAGNYNKTGLEKLDLFGTSLTGTIEIGRDHTLKLVTGYEENDRLVDENSDAGPDRLVEVTWGNSAYQVTQDIQLSSDYSGDFQWTTGASFLTENLDVDNFFELKINTYRQLFNQKTWTSSAYVQGSWVILEDLTLESGIQYNWMRKNFTIQSHRGNAYGPLTTPAIPLTNAIEDWSGLSGDLALTWDADEHISIYGKYSRGWKGGHFNGGAVTVGQKEVIPVNPEKVDSFEVGFKSFWFDQRLMLNGDVFYYDYSDLQVFTLENSANGVPTQKLINANDARVLGVEAELIARPIEGLEIRADFGWLNSRYLDFVDTLFIKRGGGFGQGSLDGVQQDYSGNPLVSAPRFSFSGTVEYAFLLGPSGEAGTLTPRWDFAFKDDVFFDPTYGIGTDPLKDFPRYALGQPAYWVHNLRLGLRSPDERYELALWVRNVFDQVYFTDAYDLSAGFGLILKVVGEPRTVGATISANF